MFQGSSFLIFMFRFSKFMDGEKSGKYEPPVNDHIAVESPHFGHRKHIFIHVPASYVSIWDVL